MFALSFRFPAGRYHATPWGRNVNEADVAWPPEPWRILRALIAAYWRKGDRARWSEDNLAGLIDALAETPPVFRLPPGAIHAHTRHYMPLAAPDRTTLIFDAFAHLPDGESITAGWPDATLEPEAFALAADLAQAIGYLGRAESWVEAEARDAWDAADKSTGANCRPVEAGGVGEAVRLIAPRPPGDYATARADLIAGVHARAAADAKGGKPPTAKALDKAVAKAFGATLPPRLLDALTLDTADFQKAGWSRPPASSEIVYAVAADAVLAVTPRRRAPATTAKRDASMPTLARFILAGRPRPRIEDAVRIGELMRLATMAKFGKNEGETGHRRFKAPAAITGHGMEGPLRDPTHAHAFWLPEDADGDGLIDHVNVYIAGGINTCVRAALDRLMKLYVAPKERAAVDADSEEAGRQEWRLALEGFGVPKDFADASGLFANAKRWRSVTPFLAAGHLKGADPEAAYARELRRLLVRRKLLSPDEALQTQIGFARIPERDLPPGVTGEVEINGAARRVLRFHRFRSRGRETQPDTQGALLDITFRKQFEGPLALGYASHFGLGLFAKL